MEERRRQAYLKALGIDSFVPRYQLPAAAPSPLCEVVFSAAELAAVAVNDRDGGIDRGIDGSIDLIAESIPVSASASDQLTSVGERLERSDLQLLLAARSATTDKQEMAVAPTVSSAASTYNISKEFPVFKLSISHFPQGVLAINSLPDDRALGYQPFNQRLLAEILFAFGLKSEVASIPEIFSWPLVRGGQIDQSVAIARDMLHTSLLAQAAKKSIKVVLLFGRVASQYLLGEPNYLSLVGRTHAIAGLGAPVIVTHSLQDLLETPLLKRETWLHLQPLSHYIPRQ